MNKLRELREWNARLNEAYRKNEETKKKLFKAKMHPHSKIL